MSPPEPKYQVGALEGFVLAAGEPADAYVRARTSKNFFDTVAHTRTDSTGWYRLELPVDRYSIHVDPASRGGRFFSSRQSNVVQVEPRVMRYDFRMGRVTVRAATSPLLESRRFQARLECVTSECRSYVESAQAESGALRIEFPLVEPNTYRIALDLSGAQTLWFPGTEREADAELVQIPDDVAVTYELSLERAAAISGSVTGSWQDARYGNPRIGVFSPDSSWVSSTSVGSEGQFRVDLLRAQPVKLSVLLRGVQQWIWGNSFRTATVFSPVPGELVEGISVVESGILCRLTGPGFRSNYRASFLLRDDFGNTYRPDGFGLNPTPISNLPPGRYFLYVHGVCDGDTWGSQWYDGALSAAAATPIDLPPGQLVPITIALDEGARIAGRISSANGAPKTAWIRVANAQNEELCGRWFNDGVFSFAGVGDGDYYLASGFLNLTWWYPGTTNFELAEPIRVRNGMDATGIEWRFPF